MKLSQAKRSAKIDKILNGIYSFFRAVIIFGISFIIIRPILVKITGSLMSESDMFDPTVIWIPRQVTLANYEAMFEFMELPGSFINSFLFAVGIALLQLISCTLVGYGFARFTFRGQKLLFALVIFTLLVPPQIIIIPLYLNFRYFNLWGVIPEPGLNLLNSYWPFVLMGLLATGMRSGLFIYIARQYFKGMPKALEEAAYVDGAGKLKTFYRVMLPGAIPIIIIIFLFSFVWRYNDYFLTSMFMRDGNLLSHALDVAAERYAHSLGVTFTLQRITILNNTGMLIFITPILILYTFMQRYFVESVERTGIVG